MIYTLQNTIKSLVKTLSEKLPGPFSMLEMTRPLIGVSPSLRLLFSFLDALNIRHVHYSYIVSLCFKCIKFCHVKLAQKINRKETTKYGNACRLQH